MAVGGVPSVSAILRQQWHGRELVNQRNLGEMSWATAKAARKGKKAARLLSMVTSVQGK